MQYLFVRYILIFAFFGLGISPGYAIVCSSFVKLNFVSDSNRAVYSERLITSIFSQPYCTVNGLVEFKVGAEKTVRKRLNKLAEMGILEKKEE